MIKISLIVRYSNYVKNDSTCTYLTPILVPSVWTKDQYEAS